MSGPAAVAWGVVVPVKLLSRAKSRLGAYGDAGRAELALAFAGELMIELIRPDPDSRSVFTEGTPERRDGLHHFGFAVDDFDARAAELGAAGRQVVFTARTLRGSRLAMVESALAGSGYEEIIELIPRTRHFYDFMRLQALTWDRAELVYSGDVPSFD